METMAKTSAAEVLPLELERLGSEGQRELAVRYDTSPDELVGVLTDRHIDGLLNPIGTAIPKLQVTTPASEGRIIADLYWRCCIAMQMSAPCESNRTSLPACSPCTPIGTPVGTRRAPAEQLPSSRWQCHLRRSRRWPSTTRTCSSTCLQMRRRRPCGVGHAAAIVYFYSPLATG